MTANSLVMPKTKTPKGVYGTLVGIAVLGGILLCTLFSSLVLDWGWFWGVVMMFGILGITTEVYTETVSGFHARILLNHLTGIQRTVFQGLSFKLPWETQTREIDLRIDLKEVCQETYASLDSMMKTRYVYTIRPNFSDPNNAGENIILYASYEEDAIKQGGRACFSMSLSDYYGKKEGKDLLDKALINLEVFKKDPGKSLIQEFEDSHGAKVTVLLEDSDFDEAAQKARNTISAAKSIREAVDMLTAKKGDEPGMTQAEAEKIVKMLNIPGVQEHIISLDAKGLENLRDVSILPPGLGGKK